MLKMKKRMIAILLTFVLTISNSAIAWAAPVEGTQDSTVSEEVENSERVEESEIGIGEDETSVSESEKQKDKISVPEEENGNAELNNIEPQTISAESKNNNGLFAGGTGTAEDPYQITTAEQMNNVRNDMSAHYVLTNDIDLSGYNNWAPIGTSSNPFTGTFDGNNHSIIGMTITNAIMDGHIGLAGMFGNCKSAFVENIQMDNISIEMDKTNDANIQLEIGGVVAEGSGDTIITNCKSNGKINISACRYMIIGGISGMLDVTSEVRSCMSNLLIIAKAVSADSQDQVLVCGGICGSFGNVTDSINYSKIDVTAGNVLKCGGICGEGADDTYIIKCINYGDIIGKTDLFQLDRQANYEIGGIIGKGGSINTCVNYGNLKGESKKIYDHLVCSAGGISGASWNYSQSIKNCYNLAKNIEGTNLSGNGTYNYTRICANAKQIDKCYSIDSTLLNGQIPTDNIGADKPNGANLSEEEILKKIEALGLNSNEKEDEEETTTKKTIQGVIEHSYGSQTADTKVEELLSEYVDDWYSAYIGYTDAVEEALMNSVEASTPTKKQAIKRRKEEMMEADDNPKNKEKYIASAGFSNDKIKDAAYEGLSTFLYDIICSEIDISNISAEDINGTKLVNTILKSVKQASNSKTYKINGIKVTIKTTGIGDVSFGSVTCNSSFFHTYTICPSTSQCQKAITNYMKELMGLADSAIYQVYSSVCKDVFGVSLDKLTEKYLTQNLTKRISKYTSKFNESGIGNLATNLNRCYNYYQYTKKMMGIIDGKESPEKILKAMETYGEFEDSSISDKVVKKAWKELKKAATNLNEAYLSYLSGTDSKLGIWWDRIKPKWGKKDTKIKATFSCPVDVLVLNSLGQQIGYAGEDDVWFDSEIIYVEEKGDAKIIYSSSEEPISFNVSATAYGVLGCSIEDYDEIGLPAGRTNYYDIELYPGKNITVSGIKNAADGKVAYTVTSDGQTINANEYIPSTQNAVVSIGCNVINNGTVDGIGSYVRGDAAVLTATPRDNSRFVGWMQGEHLLDTSRIYEFTAKENTAITALFADISDTSEDESEDSNGSGSSNNDSRKPTGTNETLNGTNNDNPVFKDISANNAPADTTSPQTGDENTFLMLIITMVIAGGVVAFNITSKKRKHI